MVFRKIARSCLKIPKNPTCAGCECLAHSVSLTCHCSVGHSAALPEVLDVVLATNQGWKPLTNITCNLRCLWKLWLVHSCPCKDYLQTRDMADMALDLAMIQGQYGEVHVIIHMQPSGAVANYWILVNTIQVNIGQSWSIHNGKHTHTSVMQSLPSESFEERKTVASDMFPWLATTAFNFDIFWLHKTT